MIVAHVMTSVTAAPLTLSEQALTFNYDTNDFQLSGNNLQVKDGGIAHDSTSGVHQAVGTAASPTFTAATLSKSGVIGPVLSCIADGAYPIFSGEFYSTTAWHGTYITSLRGRGTKASPDPVVDGDSIFSLYMACFDGGGAPTGIAVGQIQGTVDGTVSVGHVPTKWQFQVMPSVGAVYTAMTLKSTGRLGVGTETPNELLEVNGKIRANTAFNLNGADGLSTTLTLDDGTNWRITQTFTGGILTAKTTAASSGQCATWS